MFVYLFYYLFILFFPHRDNATEEAIKEDGEAGEGEEGEKEDEASEMTLDEYKEMIKKERYHKEFKTRRAGEGEDQSQWNKTTVLKKKPQEQDADYDKVCIYDLIVIIIINGAYKALNLPKNSVRTKNKKKKQQKKPHTHTHKSYELGKA